MSDLETPVGASFAKAPTMAQRFKESYQRSDAYAAETGSPAPAAQAAAQVSAPEPQPMQYFQPAGSQPQTAPMRQQEVPSPSPYEQQLLSQMRQEREALQKRIDEQQELIQRLAAERREAEERQSQEALLQSFSENPDFQNLSTVEPEDATRIAAAAANAMRGPIDALRADLEKQRQAQYQAWQQAEAYRKAQEVVKAHPDLNTLKDDPAFAAFMSGRDGYSSRTREQLAQAEYDAGNTAYVVDLINRFKAGRPNAAQVASVPPVQVAGSVTAVPQTPDGRPRFTLGELNSLMQMRRISQDQYRAMKPLVVDGAS